MQHNLSATCPRLRPGMIGLALAAALVIVGCGPLGGDDDEPTATADTISQPTASDESTVAATPANGLSEDELTQSTPLVSVATPEMPPAGLDDATPVAPPAFEGTAVAPAGDLDEASPESPVTGEPSEFDAAITGSDGTSGATPALDAELAAGDAEATPANGATPSAAGEVDLQALEPVEVASCEPENIPPFGTEQAEFLTVVDVNFRVGPGEDCDAIGDGPIGINSAVIVLSNPVVRTDDDTFVWIQVQIAGEIGWIVADAIEQVP